MAGVGIALPTPFAAAWYFTPELSLALAAGIAGSAPVLPWLSRQLELARAGRLPWLADAAAVAATFVILVASILQVASRSYSPFIYFRF
jgi:hypothetical protein